MMHAASTAYSISAPVLSCCSRVIAGEVERWPSAARSIICPPAMPDGPDGARQLEHQVGADERVLVGRGIGEDLERQGVEAVAGEHRRRFVKRLVDGRLAAPQVVVVHARQIVVDQRIDVDRLDRRAGAKRALGRRSRTVARRRTVSSGRSRLPPPIAAWRIASYSRSRPSPGDFEAVGRTSASTSADTRSRLGVEGRPRPRSTSSTSIERRRAGRLAVGAERDLLDPRLRRLEPRLAMPLQPVAALVELDRLVERRLAVLERADDLFELRPAPPRSSGRRCRSVGGVHRL